MQINKVLKKGTISLLLLSTVFYAAPVGALNKSESVYANLNNDGSLKSTIVSEHLYNIDKEEIIDRSILKNIKNINGDEKFTEKNNKIVWENKGNDIYYQGDYKYDLPISVDVKYYLDDKEYPLEKMLGKKGHVRIVLKYENKQSHTTLINGKVETLYTPFVVASTSIIDNTTNKHIKVTNGRIIDNGTKSIVLGFSTPGLYDSLKMEELKEMDKIEISYDTKKFELNSIYSMAGSKLLEDDDLDVLSQLKELYSSIDALQSNMNTLVSASNQLKDGSKKIAAGTNELNRKTKELTNTYKNYRNMDKKEITKEIINIINKNMDIIMPALQETVIKETEKSIKKNQKQIEKSVVEYSVNNSEEIFKREIEKAVQNINVDEIISNIIGSDLQNAIMSDQSIKELSTVLKDELEKELKEEITKTTKASLSTLSSSITNNMSEEERNAYIENIANTYGITVDQAREIVNKVQGDTINSIKNNINHSSDQISESISNQVIANLNNREYINSLANKYVIEVNKRISTIIANDEQLSEYQKELINNIAETLKRGLNEEELINKFNNVSQYVESLIDELVQKTAEDLAGEYTEKIAMEVVNNVLNEQLNEGSINTELGKVINSYENAIDQKLKIVDSNVDKIQDSIALLNNGANQLSNGMTLFDNGINRYNKEGINKLDRFVNNDIKGMGERIQKLIDYSREYTTIDEHTGDAKCDSKIIMVIEEVKEKETKKEENQTTNIENKKRFWEKVKDLFK